MALNARLFGAETVDLESDVITSTSDTFAIITSGLNKFTLNGYRILTTQDVQPSITLAPVGTSPNANGATITNGQLALQPASLTQPGVLSNTEQYVDGIKHFPSGIFPAPDAITYGSMTTPIPQSLLIGYAHYKCTGGTVSAAGTLTIAQNYAPVTNGNIEVWVTIIGNIVTVTLPRLEITSTVSPGKEWDLTNLTPGLPSPFIPSHPLYGAQILLGYSATGSAPIEMGMEGFGSSAFFEFYTPDASNFGTVYGLEGIQSISYVLNSFQ